MIITAYPFTEQQFASACAEWGCNCGPSALAFALGVPLEAVRHAIPGFEIKRYTSPTMMKAALEFLGRRYAAAPLPGRSSPQGVEGMFADRMALVRVQWTGPWTSAGSNPRWAYCYTHWIACWKEGPAIDSGPPMVFDCNGGVRHAESWIDEIVPLITGTYPRADGGWFPTHIWRLAAGSRA